MEIRPRQPFDFVRTLRFVLTPPPLANGRQFEPLLDHSVAGEYRRVLDINGNAILIGVEESRRAGEPRLRARVLAGPADHSTARAVLAAVERQFSIGLDLKPFYRLVASDPVLSKLTVRYQGMRIPQSPSVFETLISAILEQQVNLSFAHKVKKALIETYGKSLNYEGRKYYAFPEPAALSIVSPRELRRLQVSGPKARYLIGISRAVLDGSLDLEGLRSVEPAAIQAKLLEYKGVGPWTAGYVGLRALGLNDCLPAADVGLQKAIQHFYGLRTQPSPARVEKLGSRWAGWRSYATFYLWLTYWEESTWRKAFIEELRSSRRRVTEAGYRRKRAL